MTNRRSYTLALLGAAFLVVSTSHADPPHLAPLQAATPPDVQVGLSLDSTGKYNGGTLDFTTHIRNNTAKPLAVEAMFGPPLAGKPLNLAPHVPVSAAFSDPGGLGPCGVREYSAQAQGYPDVAKVRVSSTCTFSSSISDAWLQESPDRQTGQVYVDNLSVTTPPLCRAGGEFMTVKTNVYNRWTKGAKGVMVQLLNAGGATIGTTAAFDLAAGATETKTITAGVPASGKVEVRLVDPKNTITGVLGNPGVYVVVNASCTLAAQAVSGGLAMATAIAPH